MPRQMSHGPGAVKKRRAASLKGWRTRRRMAIVREQARQDEDSRKRRFAGMAVHRVLHSDDLEDDYDEMD